MKLHTRIISSVLALVFTVSAFSLPVFSSASNYTDVKEDAWYAKAAEYVSGKGYMVGTSKNTFSPELNFSRAMLVAVLYRMSGEKFEPFTVDSVFYDVDDSEAWFYIPVRWAESAEIVSGYPDGSFRPNAPVTREQTAVILKNYSAYMKYSERYAAEIPVFADDAEISGWAHDAVYACRQGGYIAGMPGNLFDPGSFVTRAQAAQIIYNFDTGAVRGEKKISAYFDAQNLGIRLSGIPECDIKNTDIIYYTGFDIYSVLVYGIDIRPKKNMTDKEDIARAKKSNPDLLVIMALYATAANFSKLGSNDAEAERAAKTIADSVDYVGFDGVDLDWEYPTGSGDKERVGRLLTALRAEFDRRSGENGKRYYLTMATSPNPGYYPVQVLKETCDYINIMSYDIGGVMHTTPGTAESAILSYYRAGIPLEKVLVGCGLYSQPYGNGTAHYSDLEGMLNGGGYKAYWRSDSKAPYFTDGYRYSFSMDNDDSVKEKARICDKYNSGGLMFFCYSTYKGNTLTQSAKNWLRGDFDYPNAVDWKYENASNF